MKPSGGTMLPSYEEWSLQAEIDDELSSEFLPAEASTPVLM
jgi:hypothetical protein